MSQENCSLMKEWAQEHGKSVRQRSARQETTKKKAGTLPLSMYRRPQPILDDVHNDENEDGEANEIQSEEEEYEQEMEYDIPYESPLSEDFNDQEPSESEDDEEFDESEENSDDELQALPGHLRFLARPRSSSSRVIIPNSKYGPNN